MILICIKLAQVQQVEEEKGSLNSSWKLILRRYYCLSAPEYLQQSLHYLAFNLVVVEQPSSWSCWLFENPKMTHRSVCLWKCDSLNKVITIWSRKWKWVALLAPWFKKSRNGQIHLKNLAAADTSFGSVSDHFGTLRFERLSGKDNLGMSL